MAQERQRDFEKDHADVLVRACQDLETFEGKNTAEDNSERLDDVKRELQARISVLKELKDSYEDLGPVIECVVWNDGKDWRAVVGGVEGAYQKGWIHPEKDAILDLSLKEPMTDYRKEKQHDVFDQLTSLSYTVNILDDGNLLSLVTVSSVHGTHVAGIIGAYEPESPELNGVAPGVELVSIKIEDVR